MKTPLTNAILKAFPYLKTKKHGTFIECGANDGQFISTCRWFEVHNKWSGINIECNPFCWKALKKARPKCLNLPYALTDVDNQKVEFMLPLNESDNANKRTGRGSIVFKRKWQIWDTIKKAPLRLEKHSVDAITYKTLVKRYRIKEVDLFVLDIEGNELAALRGIQDCSVLPKILCIETHEVGKKAPLEILGPYGYKIAGGTKGDTFYRIEDA